MYEVSEVCEVSEVSEVYEVFEVYEGSEGKGSQRVRETNFPASQSTNLLTHILPLLPHYPGTLLADGCAQML